MPPGADDALAAERVIEQATDAVKLLESFVNAQPKGPQTPDALLKLGYCHQRIGALLADAAGAEEGIRGRRGRRTSGSSTNSIKDPVLPSVVFERAKCLAELGDVGGAINEFNRFQHDPFHASPVAPMALLRLSILLRSQNKPADALALITRVPRAVRGAALRGQIARPTWVPMIQYEQGMAQKEAGKLTEARSTFEILAKQFPTHPEASNAAWRATQCRREDLIAQLVAARKPLANPAAKPEEIAAARRRGRWRPREREDAGGCHSSRRRINLPKTPPRLRGSRRDRSTSWRGASG